VGNVPLAAVLWRGGISFGGVVSFIFADLIILPILDIYRKYYRWKVMGYILVTFYVTMAAAGYIIEFLFAALGIIPQNRNVVAITEGIHWNYTSILNIIFLVLAAILVMRFVRTGGIAMLKMMDEPEHQMDHHDHDMGHHHMEDHDMSQHEEGHHDIGHHHMKQHETRHNEMPQ
jgi:uncharacterized membrane protein YraQ (UPF0718 family)